MTHLKIKQGVDDDIIGLAGYLHSHSPALAERFLDSVEEAFLTIARHPLAGSLKSFSAPSLSGVRTWRVPGFPNHLVFYVPRSEEVIVLAVLHGSRDAEPALKDRT